MDDTMRLTDSSLYQTDECSTDSGCSSGGSTGSAERLSKTRNHERSSSRSRCFHRFRNHEASTMRSQERLSRSSLNSQNGRSNNKSSRSWSPSDNRNHSRESPSHSLSPSDGQSTDSDSLKRTSKTDILTRALHCLKIGVFENNGKEKKLTKKSPKRILREPVSYTYVRGLSGLPTQRVPRNASQYSSPCTCNDMRLYRKNIDRR
ncbi:uncharacterized protein LOC107045079 [Diachasma alloeum]|uniref:uncharacterized protein LOC107045079 n=1 Tax=Diachasma alloeum TaxID=454923 RepID=UPI0007382E67|nr:uncharacterized protein LOC107045079 [Diachasma alloeum]